jgi:hypothetical protein
MFDILDLMGTIGGILELLIQLGEWILLPLSAF